MTTFTTDEAMAVRRRLREELALGEERLTEADLARMISDESAKMGDMKRVARIVEEVTGKSVAPEDLSPSEDGGR